MDTKIPRILQRNECKMGVLGEIMELNIGDKVLYRKNRKLYEGVIKSVQDDKVEIDDSTIKQIIVAGKIIADTNCW